MRIIYLPFLLLCVYTINCTRSSNSEKSTSNSQEAFSEQTGGPTDLTNIPILKFEEAYTIGDTDEVPLGRITNAVVLDDGHVLIYDHNNTQLHQYDGNGNHLEVVASRGRGPGEIPPLTLLAFYNNGLDTLVVTQHFSGIRRDIYTRKPGELFTYSRSVNVEPKGPRIVRFETSHPSSGFLLSFRSVQGLAQQPKDYEPYRAVFIKHELLDGTVVSDSLYTLKKALPMIESFEGGMQSLGRPPYRYEDHLVRIPGKGYIIAKADSSSLYFYDSNDILASTLALSFVERPISDLDIETNYELEQVDKKNRKKLSSYVDDYKPSFLNVWASESYLWLHTDNTEQGKEIVLIDYKGTVIGKMYIGYHNEIQHVTDAKIYTLNRDPDLIHHIQVFDIEI